MGSVTTTRERPKGLLILGLGNVLCSDDGLGAAAVALLVRRYDSPRRVRIEDGGTLGLDLMPLLEESDAVILVDAVRDDAPAGTLVELDGNAVPAAVRERLSPHQIGVADLLGGARFCGVLPDRVALLGLVPRTLATGLGLSPALETALPGLVARIVETAESLGFPFQARPPDELVPNDDPALALARVLGL
jgi:hydrogenase maturation protease